MLVVFLVKLRYSEIMSMLPSILTMVVFGRRLDQTKMSAKDKKRFWKLQAFMIILMIFLTGTVLVWMLSELF